MGQSFELGSAAVMGKLHKKQKKQIAAIAAKNSWLKSYGRGYQTKTNTNTLVRHAMKSSVRGKASKRRSG